MLSFRLVKDFPKALSSTAFLISEILPIIPVKKSAIGLNKFLACSKSPNINRQV